MLKIVIVEDNFATRDMLSAYLCAKGHQVYLAGSVLALQQQIHKLGDSIDIVLLDLNLPDCNGINIISRIRKLKNVGVLIVSSIKEKDVKLKGLSLGADDFITKPFDLEELEARIKSVARRVNTEDLEIVEYKCWQADNQTRSIITPLSERISLSKKEFALFSYLLKNPNKITRREELLAQLTEDLEPSLRSIDTQIKRLRKKIGDNGTSPYIIKTVHGEGYLFCGESPSTV